jgi:hypothetical protein
LLSGLVDHFTAPETMGKLSKNAKPLFLLKEP